MDGTETCLLVLSWNLDLVVFSILELREIVAYTVQRHHALAPIQICLVSVSPPLQAAYIFRLIWLVVDEIFLEFCLVIKISENRSNVISESHSDGSPEIRRHLYQITSSRVGQLTAIIGVVGGMHESLRNG